MKSARIASGILFALISLMLVACGDDLEEKQLNEVTDEEAQSLCEQQTEYAANAFGADEQRGSCVLSAGIAAGDMCAEATQSCVDAGEGDFLFTTDPSECDTASASDAPDCDATVGDALACTEALIDQTAAYLGSVTCDDLNEEGAMGDTPAACETYFEKCPQAAPQQ